MRLRRVDTVAQHHQLHRLRSADELGEEIKTAPIGDQADLNETFREDRAVTGDPQIACERQVHTTTGRRAIDCR